VTLAEEVLAGSRRSLGRALTLVENNTPEGQALLTLLFASAGRAHLVGITGGPGTGKSTLVNRIAHCLRHPTDGRPPRKVAVVAVDPTSPFTGGALLGDRIRMNSLACDPGVFIRSMAARGTLGGLAAATAGMVQVMDAAGYEVILIETVGAGQSEVDIAALAHTTLVVEAPGAGDDIQAAKAGILEIADILVINKADQPGVENVERALQAMLELGYGAHSEAAGSEPSTSWKPPIQRTIAVDGTGIPELVEQISQHAAFLQSSGCWRNREQTRLKSELDHLIQSALVQRWRASLDHRRYD
jgi:LAO/AO transport system kinase